MTATREDWMRRLGPLYGGAVALVHSTPWRWPNAVEDDPMRSPAWVVVMGVPVGVFAWFVAWVIRGAGIPPQLAAIMGMAALVMGSAAIVERGLAERIGFWFGSGVPATVAITFVTIIRAAAIALVPVEHWLAIFVTTAVVGRWAAVFLQSIGDPVAPEDGRSLVATPAPMWLTGALSAVVVVLVVVALGKIGIVAFALAAIGAFALGLESQKRDGGLSPAVVATAAAVGELAILLVATIR